MEGTIYLLEREGERHGMMDCGHPPDLHAAAGEEQSGEPGSVRGDVPPFRRPSPARIHGRFAMDSS